MARMQVEPGEWSGEGGTFELGAEPFQVGTSRRCQLQLKEQGISFVHAIIAADEQGFSITAKPSTAGTSVNGEPVKSGVTRRLQPGDRLAFGKVEARFLDGASASASGAPASSAPAATPAARATTRLSSPPATSAAPARGTGRLAPPPAEVEPPFGVPARMEPPPAPPPAKVPAPADAGAEALLRRLEAAEGERDALRETSRELEADAGDARRALAALEARQEALLSERDALRRQVARLEADLRLARPR